METDIRLNIALRMKYDHMLEEMLLNMEAYGYHPGEEEEFKTMVKKVYRIESLKDNFDDFLNMFLSHQSEEHGSYYPEWQDDDTLKIVSEEKKICTDQVLLDKLSKYLKRYEFKYIGQAELEIIPID